MSLIRTKKGKSREVDIYKDYVVKKPLNTNITDEDVLLNDIVLARNGELENLKEIYFWKLIEKDDFLKSAFAEIYEYNLDTTVIKAERLGIADYSNFYNKFYYKYQKLASYSKSAHGYLDNHAIENVENYGVDKDYNLKLLDYSLVVTHLFKIYNIDLEVVDVKGIDEFKTKIKDDIANGTVKEIKDLYSHLYAFVITLKYHKNIFKFLYYSYKYKLLSFKEMYQFISIKD